MLHQRACTCQICIARMFLAVLFKEASLKTTNLVSPRRSKQHILDAWEHSVQSWSALFKKPGSFLSRSLLWSKQALFTGWR